MKTAVFAIMDVSEKKGSAVELMRCLCGKARTLRKELKWELVEGGLTLNP